MRRHAAGMQFQRCAKRVSRMILPRWLNSLTEPIGIDDVLVAALGVQLSGGQWFDLPGPEALSGKQIMNRTARLLGLRPPVMLEVPFLTPRLSSRWVHFVTRAHWSVAHEVVVGLTNDLSARSQDYWIVCVAGTVPG